MQYRRTMIMLFAIQNQMRRGCILLNIATKGSQTVINMSTRGVTQTKPDLDYDTLGYVKSLDYEIEVDGVFITPAASPRKNGSKEEQRTQKMDIAGDGRKSCLILA